MLPRSRSARVALGLVLGLFALALVAHTPVVRRAVQNQAAAWLERESDLRLEAAAFDYNLATRRVTARGVRLSAIGHERTPLLTAGDVEVHLPWSIFAGRVAIERLRLADAVVTIATDAAGVSNLPPSDDAPPDPEPLALEVRTLDVRNLDVVYLDGETDTEVRVRGLRADLRTDAGRAPATAAGVLAADGGVSIRVEDQRTESRPVEGRATFDGSTVALDALRLSFPEADVRVAGQVTRALDVAMIDLRFDADARLPAAAVWADPPMTVSGTATVSGTVKGPVGETIVEATYTSEDLGLGNATGLRLTGRATITPDTLTLSPVTLTAGDTAADAHVTVPFDEGAATTVKAAWQRLPIDLLVAIAEADAVPLAARLDGSLTADLDAESSALLRLTLETRARPYARRGALPLDGRVTADVADARWRASASQQIAGALRLTADAAGVFDAADAALSTIVGRADVRVTDVAALTAAVRRAGIETPAVLADASGRLSASATLGGRLDAPTIRGNVTSDDLVLGAAGPALLGASFSVTPGEARLDEARLTVADSVLDATARAALPAGVLTGQFRLNAPTLERALAMLPAGTRPSGQVEADGVLRGTIERPEAAITIAATAIAAGAQRIDHARAELRATADRIDLTSLTAAQGEGRLQASGHYVIATGAYAATLDARGLTIEEVAGPDAGVRARVDVTFAGTGTLTKPGGDGRATVTLEGGPAAALVGTGTADLTLDGPTARFRASVAKLGARVTGTINTATPFAYRADATLSDLDLVPLALLAGARDGAIDGAISLHARLDGSLDADAAVTADIDVQRLAAGINGIPVTLARPTRLRWDADGIVADDLRIGIGRGELRASGRLAQHDGRDWRAALRADAAELLTMARAFPEVPAELGVVGTIDGRWSAPRGWDSPEAAITITDGGLTWSDLPPVRALALDAAFDGTALTVSRLTAAWQDGGIDATATIPAALLAPTPAPAPATTADAPAPAPDVSRAEPAAPAVPAAPRGDVRARLTGLTQAALAPWLDAETLGRLSGRLSATLRADIDSPDLSGVRGSLVFDEAGITVDGLAIRQIAPSRIVMADGRVRIDDVRWTAGGSPLALGGSVDLRGEEPALDLSLTGRADLRLLSAIDPTVSADGSARVDVRVLGTAAAPRLAGRLVLDDAELALADPPVFISGGGGSIDLEGDRIVFRNVGGEANGGRLTVRGALTLEGLELAGGAIDLTLQGAAVEYPPGLQSEADAALQFTPGPGGPKLAGKVRILRSAYLAPFSFPAMIAASRTVAPPPRRGPSYVDTIRLDIAVETVADTVVDNNYGRFETGTDVRIVGTVALPGITGRATLREGGQVFLAGNTFRVERGNVSFISPTGIEPDLDIRVRALVSGQDITLTITGTLDRLETDVRAADPTVPPEEIVALLLGSSGAGFGGAEALTLLSAEVLGATGRAVGLDSLRLERGFTADELIVDPSLIAAETDPSARLTMSKRLRPDVELVLSQNLRESGLSAVLSYRPRRNIELRGVSLDSLDRAYSVRHEITVGGGQAAGAPAAPSVRVSSVRISGPGVDEGALRGRLRLGAGDRFNFHAFQRDQDSLREHFHREGRFEARVRASRQTDEAAGTVALTYDIDPGPVTTLEITGYGEAGRLREELERAWTRAVVDQFLVRDFTARARRYLVRRDLFDSAVDTTIDEPDAGRKIARVSITPGEAVRGRDIRFEGRQGLEEDALREAIAAAGLDVDAWVSPERLRTPLEDLYAIGGYLDARVTPGTPRAANGRAVLDVAIDEGRRYAVGAVALEGVTPARLDAVRGALRMAAGDPYTSDAVEAARRAIELAYGRLGFNSARVDVRPTFSQELASVDVTLVVAEGLQEVFVGSVEEGTARTRPGVIERALRLTPGSPVNHAEWALARKRLYDTGVFRQVDLEAEPAGEAADGVQPVRARVTVQEWPAWRLRYGLQLNDLQPEEESAFSLPGDGGRHYSLGAVADVRSQNLFGRAIGTGLFGRFDTDRRSAVANVAFPRLAGLPVSTNFFFFGEREYVDVGDLLSFINDRQGLSAEQRWRRSRATQVAWSYRFERTHTYDPEADPDDLFPLDVRFNVARLNVTSLLDRRDDPFNTRQGWFSSAAFEYAAPAIGSDLRMAKLYLQQKGFRTLGPVVLAAYVQAGAAFAYDLIPSERFRAGGGYTVRGYAENSLGPVDFLGRPRGGNALLTINQEVRFPVFRWVNAVAFLDAGNVFASRRDLSLGDLKAGYGLGLRLDTPYAMFRIDYGRPASREPGEPRGRWYFGIGHVF